MPLPSLTATFTDDFYSSMAKDMLKTSSLLSTAFTDLKKNFIGTAEPYTVPIQYTGVDVASGPDMVMTYTSVPILEKSHFLAGMKPKFQYEALKDVVSYLETIHWYSADQQYRCETAVLALLDEVWEYIDGCYSGTALLQQWRLYGSKEDSVWEDWMDGYSITIMAGGDPVLAIMQRVLTIYREMMDSPMNDDIESAAYPEDLT